MKNWRKIIIASILAITLVLTIVSCGNKQWFDTTYYFDKAIVYLPNGDTVEGKVESWSDYEDGDQIQVRIDGKTYLVHSTNVVLISD